MTPRRTPLLAGLCALAGAVVLAESAGRSSSVPTPPPSPLKIVPGPAVMSEEERAIAPDPAGGVEYGVVLTEETVLEEDTPRYRKETYHMRAKILSNEGRDLANVTLPFNRENGTLKQWWGRTLLPDGKILELREEDLSVQEVAKARARGLQASVLRGALPGVVPGCVIDYGYSVWKRKWASMTRIPLQRHWPVRRFRMLWVPWPGIPHWYHISRGDKLALKIDNTPDGVLVSADNLPAVIEEPWSPPDDQTRAIGTFYYSIWADNRTDYWDSLAEGFELAIRSFNKDRRPLEEALAALHFPAGAGLEVKLRTAYEWMAKNLTNTSQRTAEEIDAEPDERKKERFNARAILSQKAGDAFDLDCLFIGLARLLGAEANLVLVVDRSEHYWDPGLLSDRQFDATLVAVRPPGQSDEKATVVDVGSGLPYGEIPWWFTGTKGLLARDKSGREFTVWPSEARQNLSESKARIELGVGGAPAPVRWSRSGRGQQGLEERLRLRRLDAGKRAEQLEKVCGLGEQLEVSRAQATGLEDLGAGLRLECEATLTSAGPDESMSEYRFQFRGPWIETYPEFTTPTRVNPVVLKFRRIDLATIDVTSPPGFVPVAAPPVVKLEGPLGTYALAITRTATGYHVERSLSILHLAVPPAGYEALRSFLIKVRDADGIYLHFRRAAEAS